MKRTAGLAAIGFVGVAILFSSTAAAAPAAGAGASAGPAPVPSVGPAPTIGSGPALAPARPDTAAILIALKKLRVLASVLYVGAHPDDENTRLIATLARGRLADTAYLSMTRGDGGQNLIGPEIGAGLGIIRSQELLAARRLDGGRQFFTRAIDFGYTKSPEETFRFWDKEQVLADTVRVFRQFQPDVVITRFPTDGKGGHGQHTASAILAGEAFAAAADPKRIPETAARPGVWRPRRILWNTSPWFYDKEDEFRRDGMVVVDSGEWSPLLGESFAELAARARSLHRSQGFGSEGSRGAVLEYMQHVDGDRAVEDLFEGIDTTWGRIPGGAAVGAILDRAYRDFEPEDPGGSVPVLLEARAAIRALPRGRWTDAKSAEIDAVIGACLGLYLEATAEIPSATPKETVKIAVEAANRSKVAVTLRRIALPAAGVGETPARDLARNVPFRKTIEAALPADLPDSQPYWLREKGTPGMFRVDDPALIGLPENRPALSVIFDLEIAGAPFTVERPVVFKWTDPARGELYRPFEVLPAVSVELSDPVLVFPDATPRAVTVLVHSDGPKAAGTVRLEAPPGWTITPPQREFSLEKREATQRLEFAIRPPDGAATGTIKAIATVGRRRFDRAVVHIDQVHLPVQVHMPAAETRVARLDLRRLGQEIGYLQGAGDQIPAGLRQIGYTVTELTEADLDAENLRRFDAVILGVRAYNTIAALRTRQPALHAYVEAGGTLIVQYTTGHDLQVDAIAPDLLKIGRDRVTEEDAPVRFLLPDHPALNVPNKITAADFDGWVQERGLYFASEWGAPFKAVISANDRGEPPRDGGLLVAHHGKGVFVYTGYSWFRQIPAGVPGAFRLFANLIALGQPTAPAAPAAPGGPTAPTDADRSR
jgi:LmbE family N-acetylglucosaminyl deacetylase